MGTKALTVDASVFLSFFLKDERFYQSSKRLMELLEAHDFLIVVPIITLFEVIKNYFRITKNQHSTDQIFDRLIELNVQKGIRFVPIEAGFIAQFVVHQQLFDLKTSDTIVALTAYHEKIPLITLDQKLIKQCNGKVSAMTPKQFLLKYS